jgi:hypothetical protein
MGKLILWCVQVNKGLLIMLLGISISLPVLAQQETQLKILLSFSEPMSRDSIFVPGNYEVIANGNIPVEVIKVGVVEGDTAVVLFINKEENWLSFQVTVHNLKDKAGNLINEEKNHGDFTATHTKNKLVKLIEP